MLECPAQAYLPPAKTELPLVLSLGENKREESKSTFQIRDQGLMNSISICSQSYQRAMEAGKVRCAKYPIYKQSKKQVDAMPGDQRKP